MLSLRLAQRHSASALLAVWMFATMGAAPEPALALPEPSLSASGQVSLTQIAAKQFGPGGGSVRLSSAVDGPAGGFRVSIPVYEITARANAGFGVLGAGTSLSYEQVFKGLSGPFMTASSSAGFEDNLTFFAAGRDGESGFVQVTASLAGSATAFAANNTFTSAGGRLTVEMGGEFLNIGNGASSSSGTLIDPLTQSILVEVVFGEALELAGRLNTNVRASTDVNLTSNGVGDAGAAFSNTGGITGFRVFDADMNELDYTFEAQSGQFDFYVIPEPSTALLVSIGLLGIATRRPRGV